MLTRKRLIWIGMIVGSYLGSLVPALWGSGSLSMSGVLLGALGGIVGIVLAFKASRGFYE